jgi:hypothetical protein
VGDEKEEWVPLAALGAPERSSDEDETDVPLAYIPRIPDATSARELIERSVAWGRR